MVLVGTVMILSWVINVAPASGRACASGEAAAAGPVEETTSTMGRTRGQERGRNSGGWIHYMQNRVHHTALESPAVRTRGDARVASEVEDEKRRKARERETERERERRKDMVGATKKGTKGEEVATGQPPRARIYITVPALTHGYT